MTEQWPIYLPSVLFAASVLLLGLTLWTGARTRRRQGEQARRLEALRHELRALTTAAVGVGERVLEVERRQRRLAERQDQMDLYDSANQPYDQAIKLVHKGASVEQLVEICGLNRGEAELIRMLHRLDRSA